MLGVAVLVFVVLVSVVLMVMLMVMVMVMMTMMTIAREPNGRITHRLGRRGDTAQQP